MKADLARLDSSHRERYARHLVIPEVGAVGQQRLRDACVAVVGLGGLGGPVAQYLAAAGVGRLVFIDDDVVNLSNLQRQVLFTTADVGKPKVDVAAARVRALNPDVRVETRAARITSRDALEWLREADVVVDASDNFPTRYLLSDACVLLGKPDVYASVSRFEGQASVFWGARGPCYRCLFPTPPAPGSVPDCETAGVLGAVPGLLGTIQATETLKLILGVGEPLVGRLQLVDALSANLVEVRLEKNPVCPACSENPSITKLIDYDQFCGARPGGNGMDASSITALELKKKLDRREELVLLDVREPNEHDYAHIDGDVFIPMSQLQSREKELEPHKSKELVVYCHHGNRSGRVVDYLRRKGFARARNLVGGIESWSLDVDRAMPRY